MQWIVVAAIYGGLAVTAGAFGAHGLQNRIEPSQLAAWNTGVQYHLLHSVVLLALGLFSASSGRSVLLPAVLIAVGVLLFSGSIYLLAFSVRWVWPLTPLGGLLLIGGWGSLALLGRS